jgi:hypothetical protein
VVEGLEHLPAELHVLAFAHLAVLEQREVPLVDARAAQGVAAQVASRLAPPPRPPPAH